MIFRSCFGHPTGLTPEHRRAQALAAAIVFRNCAMNRKISGAGRDACRTLMRDQALQWRWPEDVSRN